MDTVRTFLLNASVRSLEYLVRHGSGFMRILYTLYQWVALAIVG
jgi:hypothetical protein